MYGTLPSEPSENPLPTTVGCRFSLDSVGRARDRHNLFPVLLRFTVLYVEMILQRKVRMDVYLVPSADITLRFNDVFVPHTFACQWLFASVGRALTGHWDKQQLSLRGRAVSVTLARVMERLQPFPCHVVLLNLSRC